MSGETLVKCREHGITGADSCPECDRELGKGVMETRILRVEVKAEVSHLKGLEYRSGREVNTYSETGPGWDDIFHLVQGALNWQFSPSRMNGQVKATCEEWE